MEPSTKRPERPLVVRLIAPDERERFDETLEASHWLGAGLVGETMRYVAEQDGCWAALVGFGSAALCVRSRDEHIGWSEQQRWRRLRYVANNQRFLVLEDHRRPNLASQALSGALRRLSADYQERWGHPVVLAETFTDPSRHLGTCYRASNFTPLGLTSGYARRAGHFSHHGVPKVIWARPLRRDATRLLTAAFDHPALDNGETTLMSIDVNRLDLSSPEGLLTRLEAVPDPRKRRGVRHRIASILAIATLATLRGACNFRAIGETAAELPEEALCRLGARRSTATGRHVAPNEATIRRTLQAVDGDALDKVVGMWLFNQVLAGRLSEHEATRARRPGAVAGETGTSEGAGDDGSEDEASTDRGDDGDGGPLSALAVDGKALRGARLEGGGQIHLLSAMTHREGATVAQRDVDGKTNEITGFRPLLEGLDIAGVVVTADAMHAQREHAVFLRERGAHFVFGLKDNQPKLAAAAQRLIQGRPIVHEEHDRGHGRMEHRYLRVADLPVELARELKFPHGAQVVAVDRERGDLADRMASDETSYYVTSLSAHDAGPGHLAVYVRGHWGIEVRRDKPAWRRR